MTATTKLPVWATVFAAWRYLATQWRIVLPLAALLLLIGPMVVLWLSVAAHVVAPLQATAYLSLFLMGVLLDLPLFILVAIAIVPLHRAILTGPPQSGRRIPFRLGRREAMYFLFVITMSVVSAGLNLAMSPAMITTISVFLNLTLASEPSFPVMELLVAPGAVVLLIAAIVAFAYISARLSLALPAIATDHEKPLSHAWTVSRSNGWRLVAVLLIGILPILVAAMALEPSSETVLGEPVLIDGTYVFMLEESGDSPSFALVAGSAALLYTLFFLIEGAALSMSYRALGGMDETARASP